MSEIAERILVFLGGLGAGSIATALVQHWLTRRGKKEDTRFSERKIAFEGLLSAYGALAEEWSDHKAKELARWECRVQLVASQHVVDAIAELKTTEPGTAIRSAAHDEMMRAMREDLGLATK